MVARQTIVYGLCGIAAGFMSVTQAFAAPSVAVSIDTNNTIPNVVANSIVADGDGADWTGLVLWLNLTAGSVYNAPVADGEYPQEGFWNIIPGLEWDTWLGPVGGASHGNMGPAGDFGAPLDYLNHGLTGAGNQSINYTAWNTTQTDTGINRVGKISLTDDAQGTFTLGVAFAGDYMQRYITSDIVNGEMLLNLTPGDLNRDGFVGLKDLNTVLGAWNQSVTPGDPRAGDPSGDGFVGIEDLGHILGSWNLGTPPPNHNPVEMELPGDLSGDGFVGINDYKVPQHYWNMAVTPGDYLSGDPTGDGFVGMDDLNIVLTYWNTGTPPAAPATVPEPAGIALLVPAGLALARRR